MPFDSINFTGSLNNTSLFDEPENSPYNWLIQEWLVFGGLIVSSVCLLLHLMAFSIVLELRKYNGKYFASLCFALLATYIATTVSFFGNNFGTNCQGLASVIYYFSLASYVWMPIIAFDIWHSLRQGLSTTEFTFEQEWKQFWINSLIAWILPGIAFALVLVIDYIKPALLTPEFLPELGSVVCWFSRTNAMFLFYHGPLIILIIFTIMFILMAVITLLNCPKSKKPLSHFLIGQVQLKPYLLLISLMTQIWILELLLHFFSYDSLKYALDIFISTLGPYIFVAFTCTQNVRRHFTGPVSSGPNTSLRNQDTTSRDYHALPVKPDDANMVMSSIA